MTRQVLGDLTTGILGRREKDADGYALAELFGSLVFQAKDKLSDEIQQGCLKIDYWAIAVLWVLIFETVRIWPRPFQSMKPSQSLA